MKKIIIAGGSGLVGQRLTSLLLKQGHEVSWLSTSGSKQPGVRTISWDPSRSLLDGASLAEIDVIINLAGAGIADKPWTDVRKNTIIESRVDSAVCLQEAVLALPPNLRPKQYLAASAIGYYGDRGELLLEESANPGKGFLTESTVLWEQASRSFSEKTGVPTTIFRIGVVLDRNGGALKEIQRPISFGIAAYFGDGQAWYSWIHALDLCRMFVWAIENPQAQGIFNAVAPEVVRNIDLVKGIRKAKGGLSIPVPAPTFAMKFILGEMSTVVLNSTKVSSKKVEKAGFVFQFPNLSAALGDLYK